MSSKRKRSIGSNGIFGKLFRNRYLRQKPFVFFVIAFFLVHILLMLPAPLTDNAAAAFTGAPTVSNYYVTPTIGNTSTTFTYYATYTHPNNIAPTKMQVQIDKGYNYNMNYVSGSASTGMVYRYSTTLSQGSHNFTIVYSDNTSTPDYKTSMIWHPFVQSGNQTIFTSLTSGSLSPLSGSTSTTFTYTVVYSNTNGSAPINVGVNISNVHHKMSYVSGSNLTGATYKFLTTLGKGNHKYYFNCTAPPNEQIRLPASKSQFFSGPDVANTRLKSGYVTPNYGNSATTFTYYVTYSNITGSSPTNVTVVIDSTAFAMTYVSGSNLTGAIYKYTTTLAAGSHNYYFWCQNLNDYVRYPSQGTKAGPDVDDFTLTKGDVDPEYQDSLKTYTFYVTYTHFQGTPPSKIAVVINGTNEYNLTYVSGSLLGNQSYDNKTGAIYKADVTGIYPGLNTYYFYAIVNSQTVRLPTGTSNYGFYVVDTTLSGSVTPQSGNTNTEFVFRATYKNVRNLPPNSITVSIDGGNSNAMSYVSGSNQTGAIYEYKTNLSSGQHRHRYLCSNTYESKSAGNYYWPVVSKIELKNGSVSPSSGTTNTQFTYTVTYSHVNGSSPTAVYVNIDNGNNKQMSYVSGSNKTGAIYQVQTTLGSGTHTYEFYSYTWNDTGWLPVGGGGNFTGPFVSQAYLQLTNGQVIPTTGDENTTFTFRVKYTHTLNYPPYWVQVFIDTVLHNLTYVSGSLNTGAIYEYKTKLALGNHNYFFNTSTSGESARDPKTGTYSGPRVVKSGPSLDNGKVTPSSGYPSTIFNYTVTYTHTANKAPSMVNVIIDLSSVSMKHTPGNYSLGVTFWYTTSLSAGSHNFSFDSIGINETARLPSQGAYSGPTVSPLNQLLNTSVSPSQGDILTTFTYRLEYSSPGPSSPLTNVRVFIDNVSHNMTLKSPTNNSMIYEYKTTLGVGNHDYYFKVKAGGSDVRVPTTGKYQGPVVKDTAPKLSAGQVTPTAGYANSTMFNFTVRYSDLEGKSPTYARVFVNGSYHNMNYVSGSNKTGASYRYGTILLAGNYKFHFSFSDGTNAVRLPGTGDYPGPAVTEPGKPINYPPELKNGTVNPSTGNGSTLFKYSVEYMDKNGDGASVAQVVIDSVAHNMSGTAGPANTWSVFEFKTTLGVGNHNYYFYFKDTNNSAARLPVYGTFTGPTVLPPPNQAPTLYNGSVSPTSGNTSTKFTYTVWYKDPEGDKPVVNRVYIDNYPHTMILTNDADHKNGARYIYTTLLSAGNHTYYFVFNESKNEARYPKTGVLSGPVVIKTTTNTAPMLYYGRVYPTSGTPKTNFTYSVYYYDADSDKPTVFNVVIDGVAYLMKYAYGSNYPYAGQGLYTYNTRLPVGNHTYYFIFSDGTATVRLPATGVYFGPVVTNATPNYPPTLYSGKVSPYKGDTNTEFTYSVYYKDPEGKAPPTRVVYIDGSPNVMNFVSGSYTTGALFEYKTKLGVGTHNYYFFFSDGANYVRSPYYSFYYGPVVVKPNRAPTADAGPDQQSTTGTPKTLYFNGGNSSDPDRDRLTYYWDFGDGGSAWGVRVYHIFHGVGTYNVSLTVSDGKLKDTDFSSVKIIDSGKGKTQGKTPSKRAKIDTGWYLYSAAALIGFSALGMGAVIAGTEWGLYAFLGLLLPLYVRLKGKKVLDNFTRGQIYGYIIANPGDNYNSIRTALKLKNGAVAHHLQTLERENFIKSQTDGKFKRFYPFEMKVEGKATQLTTMRKNIVEHVKEEPGITQNEISEKMGVSHQAISYHLRTLVALGAVSVEKKGRKNKCFPGPNGVKLTMPDEDDGFT